MSTPEVRTAVSRAELDRRREAILAGMAEKGIDCVVVTSPHNVMYASGIELGGFWSPQALVLSSTGASRFVLRRIESHWQDAWGPQTWAVDWMPYRDDQQPADVVASAIRAAHGGPVGVLGLELDRPSMSYDYAVRIAGAVGDPRLVGASQLVERLRVRKSDEELAHIRRAGTFTRLGVEAAAAVIRDGGTDAEAAGAAFVAMISAGSDPLADTPYVATGPRTAMAHALWTHRAPADGEVIPIYMSGSVKRYQCPAERTYVKNAPDSRLAAMFEATIGACEAVLAGVRPGMTSHEADQVGRQVIEDAGFGEFFVNRLAYSFGIGFPPVWWENEIMQLRPNDDRVVETGMVFHLVPAIHAAGVGFVNRTLPIVVTETGVEALSDLPLRVDPL